MTLPSASGRRLLLAIAVWLCLWAAATLVTLEAMLAAARLLRDPQLHRNELTDFAALWLAEAYLALLGALLLTFGGVAGLRGRLGFRFTSWADIALAFGIWLPALLVAALLLSLQAFLIGRQPPSNTEELLRLAHNPLFVGVVVPTLTVLGPATEELFFRGALFGWMRTRLPVPWSIGISAAVFAGAHFIPLLFIALFVFGVAAALVYQLTGSTMNSFFLHACQNTLAVLVTYAVLARSPG